jgi:hypothetical protein
MERRLTAHLARTRRGPPMRHAARFILLVTLMRLRTALPLRLLARLLAVAHVTLWRLPDGSIRGTAASWVKWEGTFMWLSSNNRPGYSQHLHAVDILLRRLIRGDDNAYMQDAKELADKKENEGNAFFAWLAGKDRAEVIRQTLERCPAPNKLPTPPLFQWQWERDNHVDQGQLPAWQQSCYWDCIFMAKLLKVQSPT